MISKLEIAGIHTDATSDMRKYVKKKIAKLDSYMPRTARKSAHIEVKLKESKAKDKKQCTAEVIVYVPGETITAKETTVNMYAAIDIVEEKLKSQLRHYKDRNMAKYGKNEVKIRTLLGKITRRPQSS